MKPENINTINIAEVPAVMEALLVWKTDARKQNMDNEDECTAKRRMNWRKNLSTQKTIKDS